MREQRCISLPEGMWELLEKRKEEVGVPVSTTVQMAIKKFLAEVEG